MVQGEPLRTSASYDTIPLRRQIAGLGYTLYLMKDSASSLESAKGLKLIRPSLIRMVGDSIDITIVDFIGNKADPSAYESIPYRAILSVWSGLWDSTGNGQIRMHLPKGSPDTGVFTYGTDNLGEVKFHTGDPKLNSMPLYVGINLNPHNIATLVKPIAPDVIIRSILQNWLSVRAELKADYDI